MSVGKDTVINFGCYLDNRRGINVGNNVGVAHNTKIYTLGHDLMILLFRQRERRSILKTMFLSFPMQ